MMITTRSFLAIAACFLISVCGSNASALEGCGDTFGQDFSHLEPDAVRTELVLGRYRASVAKMRFISILQNNEPNGAAERIMLGSRSLLPTACFLNKSIAAQGVYHVALSVRASRLFEQELLPSEISGFDRLPRPEYPSNDTFLSNELTWFGKRFTVYCASSLSPFRKDLDGQYCRISTQLDGDVNIVALVAAGAGERPLAWQYEVWPEFTEEDIGQWQARLDDLEHVIRTLVTLN